MKNLTERIPRDLLKWTAAGFALVATATAEYEIARAIGMNEWIAAAVPGALDAYVVRALRTHREVLTSVVAMVGVNAASHLVTAGILPVEWPLITAVSAIAPLVLWRVHALGTPGEARRRVLWGLPWRARTAEHTSTAPEHTEHDRAPDNPEPPGTREHPEHAASTLDLDVPVWVNPASTAEHIACTECGTVFPSVLVLEAHQKWSGHGVHGHVHAQSTPPVPVHAPYADHVHSEHTDVHANTTPMLLPEIGNPAMRARHLSVVPDEFDPVHAAEHAPDTLCPACKHDVHTALACDSAFCDCVHNALDREHTASTCLDPELCTRTDPCPVCDPEPEHAPSTRTADDWNLEHVAKGVLTPEDTEHMERARELFHTIGGVPPYRALKEGTPGMGGPRAKRIRAALKAEAEGTD